MGMWQRALWSATAVLLLAAGLRLHQIAAQSIWFDEGWSAYAAGLPTLIEAARADLTNPPLHYVVLNAAARFIGTSELALRFVSLLLYLLTVALAFRLSRLLFGRSASVWALLLIALSPLLGWAAQEARMYTLLALLVVMAALAWHSLVQRPTRWAWLGLWAAQLGLLYAHNTGPVAVVWLNAVTVLFWITHRSPRQPDWRIWLAGQAAVGLLWLPWFSTYFIQLGAANSAVTSAPVLSAQLGFDLCQAYTIGVWSMINRELPLIALSLIALVAFVLLVPWRLPSARWLMLHAALLTAGIVAGLILLQNELHGRYLVMIAPLVLIPLGAGIARLRPLWLRLGGLSPFVLLACAVGFYAQQPQYQHDDVRTLVSYYARHLSESDTVAAWSYADRFDLAYYWERLGVRAQLLTLPEGADRQAVLPLLPASGGVSRSVWYTQRADYRGMLSCLLGHGAVDLPQTFTAAGLSDEYYAQPGRWPEVWREVEIPFTARTETVATLTRHGALPDFSPEHAVCVPLDLVLAQTTTRPLKAALVVRNALGWEIARADAVFAAPDQRTSDRLPPGALLTAYPLLRLPYGAPPAGYDVFLRLYDDGPMLSGYEPRTDGLTSGRDVWLGTWAAEDSPTWSVTNRAPQIGSAPLWLDDDLSLWTFEQMPVDEPLRNGDTLRLTLLWRGGQPPSLRLRGVGGGWSVESLPLVAANADVTLDWREVRIPPDAGSGMAQLELPGGVVLTAVEIVSVPALYEEPAVAQRTEAVWPGVGRLVGFTLLTPVIDQDTMPEIELVWQAGDEPAAAYTVFVQLIDSEGRVIAQSDSMPAQGTRPMPGWRPGEYVIDRHRLAFNPVERGGSARLIAGLYDAATNTRIRLHDGRDALTLIDSVPLR